VRERVQRRRALDVGAARDRDARAQRDRPESTTAARLDLELSVRRVRIGDDANAAPRAER
jgi:hypothetical protein